MMGRVGRCLRPALAPLRGSARYAGFGLAAITIAGCSAAYKPRVHCVGGVEYVSLHNRDITPAVDREGKPVPCESAR